MRENRRIVETSLTTGTGPYVLCHEASKGPDYARFADVLGEYWQIPYIAFHRHLDIWEKGRGRFRNGTLERVKIEANSFGTKEPIDWPAGEKEIVNDEGTALKEARALVALLGSRRRAGEL